MRRTTPFVAERDYALWPGPVSNSQYAVTEGMLVFMKPRATVLGSHRYARLTSP